MVLCTGGGFGLAWLNLSQTSSYSASSMHNCVFNCPWNKRRTQRCTCCLRKQNIIGPSYLPRHKNMKRMAGMLTRNFYESITNTKGPKTMRSPELELEWRRYLLGTLRVAWPISQIRELRTDFPMAAARLSVSVHMTNVSHHCPPTTAAITWPGTLVLSYIVFTPAMTFAPSQLSWSHCVLLSFGKKAQDTYPENAPRAGWEKVGVEKAGQVLLVARQDVMTLWPLPAGGSGFWNSGFGTLGFRESTARLIRPMILLLIAQLEQMWETALCPVIIWKSVWFGDVCQKSRVEFTAQLELEGSGCRITRGFILMFVLLRC